MSEWENVSGGRAVSTSKLNVGETFQGTYVSQKENTNTKYPKVDKEGNPVKQYNLVFKDENGDEITLFPSGTLNYKIADGVFEEGYEYLITRLENKKGVKATQFSVQRRPATK